MAERKGPLSLSGSVAGGFPGMHRDNESGRDSCLPGELAACHRYLLGWDGDERGRSAASAHPVPPFLMPQPQNSDLRPSAVVASFFSFPTTAVP